MRRQVLLWMSPDDGNENGNRDEDMVRFCLEKNDDESLLFNIFVTVLGNGILRKVISRTIKYNIPRFLRLMDPSDGTISSTDLGTYIFYIYHIQEKKCRYSKYIVCILARLTGSLRLLCHLSTLLVSTEWKDSSISGALVTFLPRTISTHLVEQVYPFLFLWLYKWS